MHCDGSQPSGHSYGCFKSQYNKIRGKKNLPGCIGGEERLQQCDDGDMPVGIATKKKKKKTKQKKKR